MAKRSGRILAAAATMLALAVWCGAVDFSADTQTRMGKVVITGKVYRQGNNVRQESSVRGIKQIIIVRADKNVAYMISPAQKTYMEMPRQPGSDASKPFDPARLRKFGEVKTVGSEKVSGFVCQKMIFAPIAKAKTMGTSTYWVSKDLQWPLRMQTKTAGGGMVMETKNIKVGSVSSSLFSLPKGYKKQAIPKMPPGASKGMPTRPHK